MIVLKFGGTSMGDDTTWQQVLDIVDTYDRPMIIVSATARTTRQLMTAAQKAIDHPDQARGIATDIQQRHQTIISNFLANYPNADQRFATNCTRWIDNSIAELHQLLDDIHDAQELSLQTKDAVAAIGERLSSYLLVQCGQAAGHSTTWVDAADVIATDSSYGQAKPNHSHINERVDSLAEKIDNGKIPVMGGYYGQNSEGHTTTLGFEGSDYSASLVGAALEADAIEIWTDVSGIYTCDPRLVDEARPISQLSFQEATELAYFGAKVLHPSTTKPASEKKIPIQVKNIFSPEKPGTTINHKTERNGRLKAITFKEHCTIITVTSSQTVMGYEFLAGVFDILRWHHLPVDVVTTTEASVSIAIEDGAALNPAIEQLENYGTVSIQNEQGIISLIGCNVTSEQTLINDVLEQTGGGPVKLISFSRSKGNLNLVMDTPNIETAVKRIHRQLFP